MARVEDRADQLSMGASSRIVKKTFDGNVLLLLNPELPLCILIGFAKHLNELQINQIGSIAEYGRWSTWMFIEPLHF